jgi:hypothetical protein
MKKVVSAVGLVTIVAVLSFAGETGKSGSWNGWVSDAKCGAKLNAACAKKCIDAGEKPVLVTDNDQKVLNVSNPDTLKDHAGHHVKVDGTLDGNTLTVKQVSMLQDQTMK